MLRCIDTVQGCGQRVASLEREIERSVHDCPVWPVIEALMALRLHPGVALTSLKVFLSGLLD
jgi:hypothetical protein